MKQVSNGKRRRPRRNATETDRDANIRDAATHRKAAWHSLLRHAGRLLLVVLFLCLTGGVLHMTVFQGEPSTILWFPGDQMAALKTVTPEQVPTLKKNSDEPFRVLVFSDIQLGLNPFANASAMRMMDALVEKTAPHFIMTTGDNGAFVYASPLIGPLIRRFESYQVPWGIVFGNHDGEGIASRNWLGLQYEKADNSVFRRGPSNIHGVGNYAVTLENSQGKRLCSFLMLDANARRVYADGVGYDTIYPDQIAWYSDTVRRLDADGSGAPHLLFFHIPLPEMAAAAAPWLDDGARAADMAAAMSDDTVADNAMPAGAVSDGSGTEPFGEMREKVCCPPVNSGMFKAIRASGSATHIFNGHDHVNNLSVVHEGIRFTYGLKTGPSTYHDGDLQGGTLITLQEGLTDGAPLDVKIEHVFMNP
jgi:hypothetical protein